jgi:hypothetical protein
MACLFMSHKRLMQVDGMNYIVTEKKSYSFLASVG